MCLRESIANFSSRMYTVERVVTVNNKQWLATRRLYGINLGLELTSIDNLPGFIEVSFNMNMLSFELINAIVNKINSNNPPVLNAESSTAHLISCECMLFF